MKKKLTPFFKKVERELAAAAQEKRQVFSGIVAYHPKGESQIDQYCRFATELTIGSMQDCLWLRDGSQASAIVIRKEVRLNLQSGENYIVFFVHNHIDASRTIKDTGCRVNKKPYKRFSDALRLAKRHFADALASGRWVDAADVVCPE